MQLHRAEWVLPIERPAIRDGALVVAGERIAWVGPWSRRPRAYRDLPREQMHEHGAAALLPGFVNPHSHVMLQAARGIADGVGLLDWFTGGVFTIDFTNDARNRAGCEAGFREGLAAGITTWGDNHFLLAPFYVAQELGIRAVCFLELFGVRGNVEAERKRLTETLAEARAHETTMVRAGISPHTLYTVPPELVRFCGELAEREGRRLSIHLAETREEREYLTSRGGKLRKVLGKSSLKWIPPIEGTLTRYLKTLGVLHERTLLIHGVHLEPAELRDIAKAGAGVVHCPVSNCRLRCGIAPIEEMLAQGIRVGLGTDSAASGERHDPFKTMELAVNLQQAVHSEAGRLTAARALELATIEGARLLGLEGEVGSLAAGKAADFIVVQWPDMAWHPHRSIEAHLVYAGERGWVRGVWINGARRI